MSLWLFEMSIKSGQREFLLTEDYIFPGGVVYHSYVSVGGTGDQNANVLLQTLNCVSADLD